MKIDLKNKVAIVTGSSQGIGLAIAKLYAEAGATVVINDYHDSDNLETAAASITPTGGKVLSVVADVTDNDQVSNLVQTAYGVSQRIDVLVNNAGGLVKRVPISDFNEDHFQTVIDINLKSSFLVSSAVLPYMKEAGSGKIINLSSQAAHDGGGPGAAAYSASKGGVWTFTKSLAKEVGGNGINVNAISPGFIASTAFHNTFTAPEVHEKVTGMVPLGRLGQAIDIARVALFLGSELSDYMTGQIVEVNGGLYMP